MREFSDTPDEPDACPPSWDTARLEPTVHARISSQGRLDFRSRRAVWGRAEAGLEGLGSPNLPREPLQPLPPPVEKTPDVPITNKRLDASPPSRTSAEGIEISFAPDRGKTEAGDRAGAHPSQLGRADGGPLAGRSAREWAARGEALRACVFGAPGEWQTRCIAGPLSAEELHDHVRRENAATVDVYRFVGGEVIAVVPSERGDGQAGAATRIFRRVFIATGREAVKSVATGLIDVSIGVPVASLLNVPKDFAGAVFYAVGLGVLRSELGME